MIPSIVMINELCNDIGDVCLSEDIDREDSLIRVQLPNNEIIEQPANEYFYKRCRACELYGIEFLKDTQSMFLKKHKNLSFVAKKHNRTAATVLNRFNHIYAPYSYKDLMKYKKYL